MKKVLLVACCFCLVISLSGCGGSSSIKKDVSFSLNAVINGDIDDGYIYSIDLEGKSIPLLGDDALIRKICNNASFKVTKIEQQGDEEATATIKIKSPDILQMMSLIAESGEVKDVNELLSALETNLDSKFSTKEYLVDISLVLIDEHWFIIPNSELVNALSGGLVKEYLILERQMVDQLTQ